MTLSFAEKGFRKREILLVGTVAPRREQQLPQELKDAPSSHQ
jgi:hypothetical protein